MKGPQKVIGYIRVSTDKQAISPDVQRNLCRTWFESARRDGTVDEDAQYMGELEDTVSGSTDLFTRPQGQHILTSVDRGDVFIVAKLSRAFRSTEDMLRSMRTFNQIGVRVICLDINIDSSTPTGKLMFTMLAAIAEFERDMISERTREALAQRAIDGQWVGQPPPGWMIMTKKQTRMKNNKLVVDDSVRKLGEFAAQQICNGISPETIAVHISTKMDTQMNRRSKARQHLWFNKKTIISWATYACCDWPQLRSRQLKEACGESPFNVDFIRANYIPPNEREETLLPSESN